MRQWDVDVGSATEDIAEDEDPETVDPIADEDDSAGRPPPLVPTSMHQKMRNFAVKLAEKSRAHPRPGLELRMLVVQLMMDLLAAGVWGPDDERWRTPLADAMIALAPGDDEAVPERALDFLGSLAAVGLALLSQDASLHGGRESDLTLRRAWEAVRIYAAMAEPELSEQYLYQPAQGYSRVAGLAGVEQIIASARDYEDDPYAAVRAAVDEVADEKGWDVDFDDGIWIVSAGRATPRVVAGRIATVVGEHARRCAVLVETDQGKCGLLRDGPVIALAESNCWKVDRLPSPVSTPNSRLSEGPIRGEAFSLTNPPPEVVGLAARVDVDLQRIRVFLDNFKRPPLQHHVLAARGEMHGLLSGVLNDTDRDAVTFAARIDGAIARLTGLEILRKSRDDEDSRNARPVA